jgi:hypothetical protein
VLAAHAAGWRVDESDIGYAQRIGDSKVTGTLRGTINAVRDMSRLLRAYRREARVRVVAPGPLRQAAESTPVVEEARS